LGCGTLIPLEFLITILVVDIMDVFLEPHIGASGGYKDERKEKL